MALRPPCPPLGEHSPLGLNPGRAFFSGAAWRVNSQAFAYRWPSSSRSAIRLGLEPVRQSPLFAGADTLLTSPGSSVLRHFVPTEAFRANRDGERGHVATNFRHGNLTPVPVRHANIGIDQRVTSHAFSPLNFTQNGYTS